MQIVPAAPTAPVADPSSFIEGEAIVGPLRVLILDDNSFDRRRLVRTCAEAGLELQVEEIAMMSELGPTLDAQSFDLIFVDYVLNDGNGLQAMNRVLSHPDHVRAAIIMIAGAGDTEVAVSAMQRGCSDYLEKSAMSGEAIRRAVTNAVQKSRLSQEVAEAQGLNASIQAVLARFAGECEAEMKPILSRMLRQLRSAAGKGGSGLEMTELEDSCQKLWAFLEEVQAYSRRVN